MTDQDIKRIAKAFDDRLKPLTGEIARVKTELSGSKTNQFGIFTELQKIGRDVARIDGELETINEELGKHTKILSAHTKTLADHSRKLNALWEQTEKVTFELEEVQETLEFHTVALQRIVDKRLTGVENQMGIVPPPELTIAG